MTRTDPRIPDGLAQLIDERPARQALAGDGAD